METRWVVTTGLFSVYYLDERFKEWDHIWDGEMISTIFDTLYEYLIVHCGS